MKQRKNRQKGGPFNIATGLFHAVIAQARVPATPTSSLSGDLLDPINPKRGSADLFSIDLAHTQGSRETLQGSFSAVPKPKFAT